ncbi:sucrose phosphatase [Crinalium epipsammum PCC 9333]|uniref:sucrose-phosphate phosphatase n=1 Tax=Crinalium epipsammum PCC 9333 TaxID=1173022 RepID=K9VZC2_9CYAN|nr:sucrose-phosphate phosphatase [Crinalium epipsammum]AFZ12847.1 sucrose phosphatase [Crinalium epipsammum PCC 9333]
MTSFLLVTDIDNTLVGDDAALKQLNTLLEQHRQEHGTKIVYATGRSPVLYQEIRAEKQLLQPDALIASVGTEVYFQNSDLPDQQWNEKISQGWDRELVVSTAAHFADLIPQSDTEQRPFKVSYHLAEPAAVEVLPRLELLLKERDLNVKTIYSAGYDLDIVPRNADKGMAVQFVRQVWDIDATRTVVCGDSGNDIALFSVGKERGIIVGNAKRELRLWYEINPAEYRYLAQAACAGGILEGLYYFGFINN